MIIVSLRLSRYLVLKLIALTLIKGYLGNYISVYYRKYNEDRVSILLNAAKPNSYTGEYWPNISVFAIYDGHGGKECADYLKDHLHEFVFKDPAFPYYPLTAIKKGFEKAEKSFINNHALDEHDNVLDRSGSCALVVFIIGKVDYLNLDDMCYIANVGDSRAVISKYGGKVTTALTHDHKPNEDTELKRIIEAGGNVYQYY
jgi:protein phosphatase 2C family protein 2/3